MSDEDVPVLSNGPEPQPSTPSPPATAALPANTSPPLLTVVGFHHARGPEVETWFGVDEGVDPAADHGWTLLPFMALSDGAHASEEDFSYFTLLRPESEKGPATSLFGLSCTRQLDSTKLINRPADVTRSTVQKAVVVIADTPQAFGVLRERLGVVTQAWFAQCDFTDRDILQHFQESLAEEKARGQLQAEEAERDQFIGLSLRELIREFKWQTLVLFKCALLQPKMLFFGSRCDRLCMIQFSLISLIPGLIRNLQDCADPELNSYETGLVKPSSLQSSNRSSMLSFMGLPLQIFGKGSLFGPYTPLQQLDILADFGTKSYIVGSTNSLLLQQKDRYSDILINLDDNSISITSPSLRSALGLTAADRRWIDYLTQEVNDTWDEANPSRPKNMQYAGSEEFIRSQFEAYLLGLISSVKYHDFLAQHGGGSGDVSEPDPAVDFGSEWVDAWSNTENYRIWNANTDSNLFAVSEPRHPCAGGLNIEDVQRRVAEQIKELHLDERLAQGRDILGRNLAAGRDKASSMFSKIYSDVEYLRESQRRRAEEARTGTGTGSAEMAEKPASPSSSAKGYGVDVSTAQQTVQTAGARASAYMSSWASWAGEKRKQGGWGGGWGRKATPKSDETASTPGSPVPIDKDYQMISPPGTRAASTDGSNPAARRDTQHSFSESILSGVSSSQSRPQTRSTDDDHDKVSDAAAKQEAALPAGTRDSGDDEKGKTVDTQQIAKP